MKPELAPDQPAPRCPRCDEELAASLTGSGKRRRIVLSCPEPYCDYAWSPTRYELERMSKRGRVADSDDRTRLAG